jgi:hypothetical protein
VEPLWLCAAKKFLQFSPFFSSAPKEPGHLGVEDITSTALLGHSLPSRDLVAVLLRDEACDDAVARLYGPDAVGSPYVNKKRQSARKGTLRRRTTMAYGEKRGGKAIVHQ